MAARTINEVKKMLKVLGRRNSVNVQKVLWCVDELGIEYTQQDAGAGFGVTQEPWFLEMNPNGLVPTIDDEGTVLWESNAILRYLASKYSSKGLWPISLADRSRVDMWMDWQLGMLMPGLNPVFLGLIRTPPEKRDLAAIAAGEARLRKAFTALDMSLGKSSYVVGESLTVADIALGCATNRWLLLDIQRPSLPNLISWFDRIRARPAFKLHVLSELS
jgi:glutathione S-transferase